MNWSFISDILLLLLAAAALGALAEYLRQSAIVGFLLAGALVAPWLESETLMHSLAELGVALLLFSIGLEFSWSRLKRIGWVGLWSGILQITLTLLCFSALWYGFARNFAEAVVIGAIVALSSTAVVLRTLSARGEIDSVHGRSSLGVLLLQDVAVVPLMLLVDSVSPDSTHGGGMLILWTLIKELALAAILVGVFITLARYILPYVLMSKTLHRNRELTILIGVLCALGSSWIAYELGLSAALGAFVAGVVLGESPLATQIRADVGPLKTLFVTLFFSSIGMLADVVWIAEHALSVVGVFIAVILGKAIIIWVAGRRLGMAHRHAIATGLCVAQVGEFSFVIAIEAADLIGDDLFKLLVSVTVLTLFATPYLIQWAPGIGSTIERGMRRRGWVKTTDANDETIKETPMAGHVIVIGFGPAGREVTEALETQQIPVLVIELNPNTVMQARAQGRQALVGDGATPEILEHAHIETARAVVVTLPDHRAAIATVQQVRAIVPQMRLIVRSRHNRYVDELLEAGAHTVVPEETSVGQALVVEVNQSL